MQKFTPIRVTVDELFADEQRHKKKERVTADFMYHKTHTSIAFVTITARRHSEMANFHRADRDS